MGLEAMSELLEDVVVDAPVPLLLMHRDMGRLEGKVQALEGDMREIKGSLRTIYGRINEVWTIVSEVTGEQKGERESRRDLFGMFGWGVSVSIAGLTAWIMVKYGR